jgi:Polysaccharide biosynthesis protein
VEHGRSTEASDPVTSGGARIIRNISALGSGQMFTWLTSIALVALLPRYLGDQLLGKLATANSLTDLCGIIASLGITTYLTKQVARNGVDHNSEVLNALATRAPLAALATAVAVVSATSLGYDPLIQQLVLLYCINFTLAAASGVLSGALQGLQEMGTVAFVGGLSNGRGDRGDVRRLPAATAPARWTARTCRSPRLASTAGRQPTVLHLASRTHGLRPDRRRDPEAVDR